MRPLTLLLQLYPLVFGLCCVSGSAHASSARAVDLPTLVQRSDAVVLGTTKRQEAFWQGTQIFTLTTVQIHEVWTHSRPSPGRTVDVVTPGGIVGNIGQRVDGAAQLPLGEQLVLHLKAAQTGEYAVVAMGQGVWLVGQKKDRRDAEASMSHRMGQSLAADRGGGDGDRPVSRPGAGHLWGSPAAAAAMPTTLAALRHAVQEAADAP